MDLSSVLRLRGVSPDQINMDMLPGGSGFGGIPQAPDLPPPPPPPRGRDLSYGDIALPAEHVGVGRKIGAALLEGFGASPEVVRNVRHPDSDQRQTQALMQRIAQARRLFPEDEQAQMLWVSGDDDFRKAVAGRYEDKPLSEGTAIGRNGKIIARNKKTTVGVDGGVGYRGDDENGVTFGDQRQPSHAEAETAAHDRATEAHDAEVHADTEQDKADERDPTQGILRKVARGETLNPGEQKIYDAWEEHQKKGSGFDFGGLGGGNPAPAPPKPTDAPTSGPRRAMPAAELATALGPARRTVTPGKSAPKVNEGDTVVQNGNIYSYRNGAFVYVRPAR